VPVYSEFVNQNRNIVAYVAKAAQPGVLSPLRLGVWDAASGKQLTTLLQDGLTANSIRVTPDRQRLYVSASDQNIYVFDVATWKRINTLSDMELIDFSPDGHRILAKNNEGIRLMDAETLSPLARMPGQLRAFIAPSGHIFATTGSSGLLTLWKFDS